MKQGYTNLGFTILELIIASAISAVVITGFSLFAVHIFKSSQFSFDENLAISRAESGLEQMIKQIREAQPSNNGSYPLVSTNDQEFIFYGDIDNDGDAERIRYYLENTTLNRGIIEPVGIPAQYLEENEVTRVISDHIRNNTDPVFYYYNGDWPADIINNPLSVEFRLIETRLIKVFLRVNVNEQAKPNAFELSSSTQLRNLKSNL